MKSDPLKANGLLCPPDFPATEYDSIRCTVLGKCGRNLKYGLFAGAWNALGYRFCGMHEDLLIFEQSLSSQGAGPEPAERLKQERALFGFFGSAVTVFDAAYFALFVIGALVRPREFPIETEKDETNVTRSTTRRAFLKAFPHDHIVAALETLANDPHLEQLVGIRNKLTHRLVFARHHSIGGQGPGAMWGRLPLTAATLDPFRDDVSRMLKPFLGSVDEFSKRIL